MSQTTRLLFIPFTFVAALSASACVEDPAALTDEELALDGATTPVRYEGTTVVDGRTLTVSWRLDLPTSGQTAGVTREVRTFPSGARCLETASAPVATQLTIRDGAQILFDQPRDLELRLQNNQVLRGSCAGPTTGFELVRAQRRAAVFGFGGRDIAVGAYANIVLDSDQFTSLLVDNVGPVTFDEASGRLGAIQLQDRIRIDVALFRPGSHGTFAPATQSTTLTRR